MATTDVASPFVRQPRISEHGPILRNGESHFARVLETDGIEYGYECFLYPLAFAPDGQLTLAFTPDFWLPASAHWPELHIELTWADRNLEHTRQKERVRARECLNRKKSKIEQLRQLYGLETLLVTHQSWIRIVQGKRRLDELIYDLLMHHEHPFVMDLRVS